MCVKTCLSQTLTNGLGPRILTEDRIGRYPLPDMWWKYRLPEAQQYSHSRLVSSALRRQPQPCSQASQRQNSVWQRRKHPNRFVEEKKNLIGSLLLIPIMPPWFTINSSFLSGNCLGSPSSIQCGKPLTYEVTSQGRDTRLFDSCYESRIKY